MTGHIRVQNEVCLQDDGHARQWACRRFSIKIWKDVFESPWLWVLPNAFGDSIALCFRCDHIATEQNIPGELAQLTVNPVTSPLWRGKFHNSRKSAIWQVWGLCASLTWSLRVHCSVQMSVMRLRACLAISSKNMLHRDRLRSPMWCLCREGGTKRVISGDLP